MKHKHICKGCSKEFYGRKNQEFHNIQCKTDYNNEKARILRDELNDNKITQKNYLILRAVYDVQKNVPVLLTEILKRGFDSSAPTRKVKTLKNGYELFMANGIGYRVFIKDNKQYISIYKSNELYNI